MTSALRAVQDIARLGAERFGRRPAVLRPALGGAGFSYAELWLRAQQAGANLRASGLRPGERVLLSLGGCPEWAVAFFGILEAGLVAVPILADTPAAAAGAIATSTGARARVTGARTSASPPELSGLREIPIDRLLRPESQAEAEHRGAAPPGRTVPGPETAILAFTSGSTSRPRAVELTHENLLANLAALLRVRRAGPDDALLSMLPPAHLFELMAGLLAPLSCGARVVYAGPPLPNRLIDALCRDRITHALTVPALLHALYEEILDGLAAGKASEPGRRRQELEESAGRLEGLRPAQLERLRAAVRSRLGEAFRVLCVGGAAVDPIWPRVLTPLGIALEVGYGLSEASPIVSLGLASESPPGSVGRALPGVEVRVDERGEILVRGPGVMRGYWGDREETSVALRGGWLHTGDLGRLDGEGFLFVTGRLKDVMVTAAGETLHPEEIEPYYESSLFAEHCVVPVKGEQGNDVPTLVIVPARADITDRELEAAFARLRASAPVRGRVAGFVRVADSLPRTALGKLRRRALAEELAGEEGGRA